MSDFYTVLLSGLERVKSKLGGIPTVHVCLVPLTVLLCLPGGSFHSPHVPGEDALVRAPARAPAVLPASQVHGNVGVHRVTRQHCKSGSSGITPGTHLWNPSPSHPRASVLWERAYIDVPLFQLSL